MKGTRKGCGFSTDGAIGVVRGLKGRCQQTVWFFRGWYNRDEGY